MLLEMRHLQKRVHLAVMQDLVTKTFQLQGASKKKKYDLEAN